MRALSFLPAATRTIQDLGLEHLLHGVTFECPSDRPRIVRSRLEGQTLSSADITQAVADATARGETLYYLDEPLLEAANADIVFTQHLCNVCQIGTAIVERAVRRLPRVPAIVPLTPHRLSDVAEDTLTIAGALGELERGRSLVDAAMARVDAIGERLHAARARVRRVMVIEWLDPLFNAGHWIPDQVALAGGHDALATPGGHSAPIDWQQILRRNPEVIILAPCGFDVERTAREARALTAYEGFATLPAVLNGNVFIADGELFTQPSLSTLVEGIALLAHCFHPGVIARPDTFDRRIRRATFL